MKRFIIPALSLVLVLAASCSRVKDGDYVFQILTTNDVHGAYFDSTYTSTRTRPSLLAVSAYVDSVRTAIGKDYVVLLDGGDCLQGDNASYYFNYVDTSSVHIYARMADYMGYDAVAVGNHDIEAGHPVYDRIRRQMKAPLLASNALKESDREPYFLDYVTFVRKGVKFAVVGYTNPNIKKWLSEEQWKGMYFEALVPFVQQDVNIIREKENPDVLIVVAHTGTGRGDGSDFENCGADLFNTLEGVDLVVCAHDHRQEVLNGDGICMLNAGSRCNYIGVCEIALTFEKGECVAKKLNGRLAKVDKDKVDQKMKEKFREDYEKVKAFTVKEIGTLAVDIRTREAFIGQSDYLNLIHTVSLSAEPANISFAAPLTYNGLISAGTLVYNDLFTIYPYENQLVVVKMTGKEIRKYLEYSYNTWINTVSFKNLNGHLLKIIDREDKRNGGKRYSFKNASFNFDSAGGLVYSVDVTKLYGQRVYIESLAGGEPFSESAWYNVAMTSYRANGGGDILKEGAGLDTEKIEERIVAQYPEIRDMIYEYVTSFGTIDPAVIGDKAVVGEWSFIPESVAAPMLKKDFNLLFSSL